MRGIRISRLQKIVIACALIGLGVMLLTVPYRAVYNRTILARYRARLVTISSLRHPIRWPVKTPSGADFDRVEALYEHKKHDGSLPLLDVSTFLAKDGCAEVAPILN